MSDPIDSEASEALQWTEEIILGLSQLFMAFGGIVPYIPQYLEIVKTGDPSGFSTFVCFLLITSNTLRIIYWFGHNFDEALLFQSILMLCVMFALLELCLRKERMRQEARGLHVTESYFTELRLEEFWQWTTIWSFLQFSILIGTTAATIMIIYKDNPVVVEGIGYTALTTESLLALPQFIKNQRNKSVAGMNIMMVIFWIIGFKEAFYILRQQPLPFVMCASIQLFVDFLICIQICAYRNN